MLCQPIDGRCRGANSLRGLTGTKSKQKQKLPADNLANPSTWRTASCDAFERSSVIAPFVYWSVPRSQSGTDWHSE
uniref:Uncharacterized protein n=1 Tax=Knipowitschia caucasica TaxID=637954 RepID=A0AAV2MA27_KNICA